MLIRTLVIADRSHLQQRLDAVVRPLGTSVTVVPPVGDFWQRIVKTSFDLVVVTRPVLPEPVAESISAIRRLPDEPDVIVVWNEESPEERASLLIAGCFAVLYEGLSDETLRDAIGSFVERRRTRSTDRIRRDVAESEYRLTDFSSSNPMMASFMNIVRRVVEPDSSLLILGETGVGKERLARAIHAESPRSQEPFMPVSCAALPEALLEAELFGHVEGAFTGASGDRRGYFELAHEGTLFLDEIGELPKHLQIKLLRVLQERTIQRVGGEEEIPIDVRVMAATNRNLDEEMREGRFRRDLYYRLAVVTLEIPSLREHPEDIPPLIERYLEQFRVRMGRPVSSISDEAVAALCAYGWPGNIRELMNVVERAVILCDGNTLTLNDLPRGIVSGSATDPLSVGRGHGMILGVDADSEPWSVVRPRVLGSCERAYLEHHLRVARGRLVDVAESTGLTSRAVYAMMKRHGLRKEDYRHRAGPPAGRAQGA